MQIYVIGGAVRNVLLNILIADMDYVVVGSTVQHMLDAGFKQVGSSFPVFLNDKGEEYALARKEQKVGVGYTAFECEIGDHITLRDDQYRRDITINQLAVRVEDWNTFVKTKNTALVLDCCNGLNDIKHKYIRHISHHFNEDSVRILRICRFAANFKFSVVRSTMELMTNMVKNGDVDHLVPERIWAEMNKAIMLTNAMDFFWTLHRCGALKKIVPGLAKAMVIHGIAVRSATLRKHNFDVRMMLIFGYLEDPQDTLLKLKAPSKVIERVVLFKQAEALIQSLMLPENILDFLHGIKDSNVLYDISTALSVVSFTEGVSFDKVIAAHNATQSVSFQSLSVEDQQQLKGAAIGEAINKLKVDAIQLNQILP